MASTPPDPAAATPFSPAASRGAGVEFVDATMRYPNGTVGLKGIDLSIAPGEMVVVVGLSGAGKSTLIRSINGLVTLTGGDVRVGGASVVSARGRRLREIRSDVGMIFQSFNLVTRTSVLNNVLMGRLHATSTVKTLLCITSAADKAIAMDALARVEIPHKVYDRAGELSGGQQQRVAIARALAQQPKVLLADEPVASLDPPTSQVVMRDLQRINQELGITVLVNLHFLDLARSFGDRLIGMRAGEVVYDGPGSKADEGVFEDSYGRSRTGQDLMASETAL
ncbi:MAG: phosphonate ABC transporter ATP-binding protein [Nakamurella sp.]